MKYSLVEGKKSEAFPKGKGNCILCGNETNAKCGTRNIHHWAHKSLKLCDSWWENETEWHRNWKNKFPKEWQEVIHFDNDTGEKHIADIKTAKGIVIELQNSPISTEELISREYFYKNMIWVVNAEKFRDNFHILFKLPNPQADFIKDIAFHPGNRNHNSLYFHKYSEVVGEEFPMRIIHSGTEIQAEISETYIGHHLFDWIKPRTVWLEAKCGVFLDFGDDNLWKLVNYDNRGLKCIRRINKNYFIKKATNHK